LINKTTYLILIAVIFFGILMFVVNVFSLDTGIGYKENNELYFQSSFTAVKMIAVFFSVFFACNSFSVKNDQYYYLITFHVSRSKYFVSKLFTVLILELLFMWILFVAHIFIGFVFYPKYTFNYDILVGYLNIWILMIYYGLISLICYLPIKNNYIIIVVFSFYILHMIVNENGGVVKSFINYFFLYLTEQGNFYYHFYHSMLSIIILFLLNFIVYLYIDL